jgi:hypothetical protein
VKTIYLSRLKNQINGRAQSPSKLSTYFQRVPTIEGLEWRAQVV